MEACALAGAELVVNPNGTIDAAAPDVLFRGVTSTNPAVLVHRGEAGPESLTLTGLEGVDITAGFDAARYASKVIVAGRAGDGATVATGSSSASSVPYRDLHGNLIVRTRVVNAPDTEASNTNAVAVNELALSTVNRGLQVGCRDDARRFIRPGDWVWAFDQDARVTDPSRRVQYRGEPHLPAKVRTTGIRWPLRPGMGVFHRAADTAGTITDLTKWVDWGDATTVLELGERPVEETVPSLGPADDIQARALIGKAITWPSPTWSGTLGDGTLTAKYIRTGDGCWCEIDLTWGTTTTHPAATMTFGIPFTASRSFAAVGSARIDNTGVARYNRTVSLASTTTVFMDSEAGVPVTNTVPFTPNAGDRYVLTFFVPLA
jgi:hypothetical protein